MIFVSVGTYRTGFDRLIREVDRLAGNRILKNVIAQIGYTKYQPKFIKYKRFFSGSEMDKLIKKSSFLIVHGGTGTLSQGLRCKKKIIAVPRFKKYNELFNNHQLEIVRLLESQKRILAVYNIKDLENAVKTISKFHPEKIKCDKCRITEIVERFIHEN